jgi:hypothetical protein
MRRGESSRDIDGKSQKKPIQSSKVKERSYEIISYIFSKIVFLFALYVLIKHMLRLKILPKLLKSTTRIG